MNGTDWAYETLVDIALAHSKEHVRTRAEQFRPEVLEACIGMACCDIDWHTTKKSTKYAYETVRDVCIELTKVTVAMDRTDYERTQQGHPVAYVCQCEQCVRARTQI